MVEHVEGNLFESGAAVLVNPVNCVGASGRGLAREFAVRYPHMERGYRAACQRGDLAPGRFYLWRPAALGAPMVLCFPTKRHWRQPSRIEDIEAGLAAVQQIDLPSPVALPRLGCGLGGLSWDAVRPLVEHYLGPLPGRFAVYSG